MRRPISALVRTAAIGRAAAGQRGAEGAVGELAYGPSPYARPPRSPPRFFRHVSTASMRRRHPAAARLQSAALLLEHCCNSRFYCAAFSSCASRSASAIHLHDLPHRHVRRHRRPRGALIKIILRTRQGHQREGVSGGGGQRRRTARAQRSQTGSAGSAKRARHAKNFSNPSPWARRLSLLPTRGAPRPRGTEVFNLLLHKPDVSNGTDEHVTWFVERRCDATRQYGIGSGGIDTPQHSPHTSSRPQPQRRSARGTRERGS